MVGECDFLVAAEVAAAYLQVWLAVSEYDQARSSTSLRDTQRDPETQRSGS